MNDPSRGSVEQPVRARRLTPYALPLALAISLGLHAGMALTVAEMSTVPELDFEFGMPDQVEFGMTEAMEAVMVNAPPIQEALDESAAGDEGDGEGEGPGAHATEDAGVMAMDAGVMAGIDGGMDDAAVNDAGGLGSDGLDGGVPLQVADAGPDASTDAGPNVSRLPVASATVHGPARIPAGAQLALRLDMGRLRQSVVANEVRALIAAVPDWQELLGGSGIDPLNDLERVLIATPNRYRSRILVAGRHVHDEAFTRAAVDRMAGARGTQATWATQDGVQVAPWANEGNTPRVLAMLSPQHFTISRSEDLAVALAMTEARAARGGEAEGLEEAVGPDVLLSMGPNEGLSLEIEGVHAFLMSAGNPDVIPLRARLAIREVGPRIVAIDGVAVFPSEQLAADAIAYWTAQRDGAVQSFAVRMVLGNRVSVLQSFTFVPQGERVEIRGRATADDVRYGLDLARRQFEAWAREAERRRAAAAGGGSTTGTPAATPAP
ncbi:MAG: hypothetical protein KBB95_08455 [Deltaproteobacteria bacterium]|jgi:hypothetical protein|nr:hypothetical protein [Deltaproteobacteria bacterium]